VNDCQGDPRGRLTCINLSREASQEAERFVGARVGLGSTRVPPTWKPDEQDAGDHKGPPNPTSAALAPTDADEPLLRLMRIGRPRGSPWKSNRIPSDHSQTLILQAISWCSLLN